MNYQNIPKEITEEIQNQVMELFAMLGFNISFNDLKYYAWPQDICSIEGQSISVSTVHCFEYSGTAVMFYNGILQFTENFEYLMQFKVF